MLIAPENSLYIYPITRDLGFAPNPFHGVCTLATCKPRIRKGARTGDWIMGLGGASCRDARGKCIFLMQVTRKLSFDEYWNEPQFLRKRPVRNGSLKMLVGDNIYRFDSIGGWIQADSHHSLPDGSPNAINVKRDTGSTDQMLISEKFLYFGAKAEMVDLGPVGYLESRVRDYRRFSFEKRREAANLVGHLISKHRKSLNCILGDPVHFESAHKRVNQENGKFT